MHGTSYLALSIVFAAFAVALPVDSATMVVTATEHTTILVIEIDSVQPSADCTAVLRPNSCKVTIHGQVTRVLKDAQHQGLRPGIFEAQIPRYLYGMVPTGSPWAGWNVERGQEYLIFSDRGAGLAATIESPAGEYLVTTNEDAVADVELILGSASLDVREQAAAASAAIGGVKQRSLMFAEYAAALLAAGSDGDTAVLAHAIENSKKSAFSEWAKGSLLGQLWSGLRVLDNGPENPLHVFVTMTARYLVEAPDNPAEGHPDIRASVARNYVPWILGSERAKSILRTALPSQLADKLREKARMCGDSQLSSAERARMRQLANVLILQ